jgi:hypothetical protein
MRWHNITSFNGITFNKLKVENKNKNSNFDYKKKKKTEVIENLKLNRRYEHKLLKK